MAFYIVHHQSWIVCTPFVIIDNIGTVFKANALSGTDRSCVALSACVRCDTDVLEYVIRHEINDRFRHSLISD
jgi:hypothetical protein